MTHPKFQNHLLPYESIELNIKYTFTVSPSDAHQYFNIEDRDEKFRKFWISHFSKWKDINVYLHPEVSPKGRLHLHGTILFKTNKSIKQYYLYYIVDLLNKSQTEVDTIQDESVWATYCGKQSKLFHWVIDNTKCEKLASMTNKEIECVYKPFSEFLSK